MNKHIDPADLDAQAAQTPAPAPAMTAKRKKLFAVLGGTVLLAGGAFGAYQLLVASQYVETDNAYVGAESAQVTPRVEGAVAQVLVSDTQKVAAGQPLVILDDADARLQLAQAESALSQAERRVRGWLANDRSLAAQMDARGADEARAEAQFASAQSDLQRAKLEFDRRRALAETGAVSAEELTRADTAFRQADAALRAARAARLQAAASHQAAAGALESNRAMTENADVANNPEVAAARARRDRARLDLERTVIRAPVAGVVTGRKVQVGQRIQPGANLMIIAPVQDAYVDANFKEGQLTKVRDGQTVELESDLYGGKVTFHGRVVGLSGGTGSAYALIPAQNATGNWIKVVQRVPVRIRLDPAELQAHPLRVGLSMTAKVHVGR